MIDPRAASRMVRSTCLTSPSTRYRSPVTTIISVVEIGDGGWVSLELISQVGASGPAVYHDAAVGRRVSIDGGGYRPKLAARNPDSHGCRSATVVGASSVAAREVLLADAANLLPNVFRAGKEGPKMPLYVVNAVGARVSIAGVQAGGRREFGPPRAILRPGEVTR
jgi:hypothetical protein